MFGSAGRGAKRREDIHVYAERPSRIAGCVLWVSCGPAGSETLVVPDGCTDVIWLDGRLTVAGPDTVPHRHARGTAGATVGLRFGPGIGPRLFGAPAGELRDARLPLDQLWPAAGVSELEERLSAGETAGGLLEWAVSRREETLPPADARVEPLVAALRSGESVASAARIVGQSERQLRRLATEVFGYSAKTLQRILRFQRAVALARRGEPLATAAYGVGYADQAHMAREVRELAGVPMTALLSS